MSADDEMLEQLRCSVCNEYLSCAPIQLLPDGENVCGNCRPSGSEAPSYRNVALELVLSTKSFPCKYQSYGCEKRLPFGETTNHNATCEVRTSPCPIPECLWNQPIGLLSGHFNDNHPDRVVKRAEFKLDVTENKEEVAMFVVEDINFFLKYKYNAAAREFYHDVRFFKSVKEACYKINFLNNSNNDYDYSVTAKGFQCRVYGYDFNNSRMSNGLINLGDHLTALNQPNEITVWMDLSFRDLLLCVKCKHLLAIPIFESEGAYVCGNCCKRLSEPTTNGDIVQHVKKSLIPCRWENCKTVKKGDEIRQHEKTCKKRIYHCIVPDCSDSFDRFEKDAHMQTHKKYKNCLDNYFQMNCLTIFAVNNSFYAIIEDEIIVLECKLVFHGQPQMGYTIKIKTTDYANNSRITAMFSHYNMPSTLFSSPSQFCQCKVRREVQFNEINEITIQPRMFANCFINGNLHIDIRLQ